jgi:membrane-bound inhibitor of C-type lysozyme
MKKLISSSLVAIALVFSFVINSFAAGQVSVTLSSTEYSDGTTTLYFNTGDTVKIKVVNSGSKTVMWVLKKGSTDVLSNVVSGGTTREYSFPVSDLSSGSGYYSLALDCDPNSSTTGCSASGYLTN